jgi:hypothetical protein
MTVTSARPESVSRLSGRRNDDRGLRSRPRRGGLLAFAALMIVGSAVSVAVLVNRAGDTQEVFAARTNIAEGHIINSGDLVTKRVAGIDGVFVAGDASMLLGSSAVVGVVPGQVITQAMVSKSPTPAKGESLVGLNLDPARAPSAGLSAGDHVTVVAVPGGDGGADEAQLEAPTVLAVNAKVFDIAGSAVEGGGSLVTIVVPEADAARVAAFSTAGRIAIVEIGMGDEAGGS